MRAKAAHSARARARVLARPRVAASAMPSSLAVLCNVDLNRRNRTPLGKARGQDPTQRWQI